MKRLRRAFIRLGHTVARTRYEERLRAEIEDHLDRQTDDNLRAGLPRAEARRQAVLKFGAIEDIKERYRANQSLTVISDIWRDVRYGVRTMRRSPGFTAVALLTLAIGIAGNTTIYSAINGILADRLPYVDASRLLMIWREQTTWGITPNEQRAIQEASPAFERMAAVDMFFRRIQAVDGGRAMRRWVAHVSGEFFPMLGVRPLIGRALRAEDAQPGRALVAVLSHNLWRGGFGSDPGVVGTDIMVNEDRYSVVGVMPERFELGINLSGEDGDGLWVPLVESSGNQRNSLVIGQVRQGVPLSVAEAQIKAVSSLLPNRFPPNEEHTALVTKQPGREIDADVRYALQLLQAAVAIVLLIASVNLSALLIARAWTRQRELSVRRALGANRSRLFRRLLTESLLLALVAGALGVVLSFWGVEVVRAIAPPGTPRLDRVQLDGRVLAFTLAVSVISAIVFGVLPAVQAARGSSPEKPEGGLRPSSGSGVRRRHHVLRNGLLIAEIALAVVLVIGGALLVRSFDNLMRLDTGVQADGVMTMRVEFSDKVCRLPCEATADRLVNALTATPGIERAALSIGGLLAGGFHFREGVVVDGSPTVQPFDGGLRAVTSGFFGTAGIRLLAGRHFVPTDRAEVAIVSEEFARTYLGPNPLGRRFSTHRRADGPVWREVVGVVADVRDRSISGPLFSGPPYYAPFNAGFNQWLVLARTSSADPTSISPAMQAIVRSLDRTAIITDVRTLEQVLAESVALPRFQASLFGLFGLVALLLAVIGIYGVTSYGVVQRTHEIGVRMALGARKMDVVRGIVAQSAALALAGIALGLAGAFVLARTLRSMLFGVQPVDSWTFLGAAVLLLMAALAASYLPARTAMRVDPLAALRHE